MLISEKHGYAFTPPRLRSSTQWWFSAIKYIFEPETLAVTHSLIGAPLRKATRALLAAHQLQRCWDRTRRPASSRREIWPSGNFLRERVRISRHEIAGDRCARKKIGYRIIAFGVFFWSAGPGPVFR